MLTSDYSTCDDGVKQLRRKCRVRSCKTAALVTVVIVVFFITSLPILVYFVSDIMLAESVDMTEIDT